MCSNTTVSLTVKNFNDEVPHFDLVQYHVDVFEDMPADVILQQWPQMETQAPMPSSGTPCSEAV